MAAPGPLLSEMQFQCCICQDVLSNPVSIPCGHSFCLTCITSHWHGSTIIRCPRCQAAFDSRPELCENSFAKEMSEQIRSRRQNGVKSVPCDICVWRQAKAVKSCRMCLVSLCEHHLEHHLRVFALKKHTLIDPMPMTQERVCARHLRRLELYCKHDRRCVCMLCMETDHKGHDTVHVQEESQEKKVHIRRIEADVQQMIQTRLQKVKEIKRNIHQSKENTKRDVEHSLQVFAALFRVIKRSQAELVETMERKQKAAEERAQSLITELEQEIIELQKRRHGMEQLLRSNDHLDVLQRFPALSFPTPTRSCSDLYVYSETCLVTAQRTVGGLQQHLQSEMKKLSARELEKIQEYAADVYLDPKTANAWMVVSEDGRRIWDGDVGQDLPDSPQRFVMAPCALALRGFTAGRHYWEVEVGDKTAWDLGVARESIDRKGAITLSPQDGYWAVCLRNGFQYWACTGQAELLSHPNRVLIVGVFLDYEDGTVSFYDAENKTLIYSFTGFLFSEAMFPFFNPDLSDSSSNRSPLIIRPASTIYESRDVDDVTI